MKTIDDILYPYYLDYYRDSEGFYSRNIDTIKELFKELSNGGNFWFKYTKAKDGNYCYSVDMVYKNKLIKNRVGYKTKSISLMSILDGIKNNEFEIFVV